MADTSVATVSDQMLKERKKIQFSKIGLSRV